MKFTMNQLQAAAIKPGRVVIIAAAFTAVMTLYSLSELNTLTAANDVRDKQLPTHFADWREIEELALHNIEDSLTKLPKFRHGTPAGHAGAPPLQSQPSIATPVTASAPTTASATPATTAATLTTTPTTTTSAPAAQTQVAGTPADVGGFPQSCHKAENTELWGDVVAWGPQHKKDSWQDCCKACQDYKPPSANDIGCNVWVWCGDKAKCGSQYGECWLKHLVRPEASKPARQGPAVFWTSGTLGSSIADEDVPMPATEDEATQRRFHTITTAQGSATHWQMRVHYYWFKKRKAECEAAGKCMMGGFTRLLHSGQADDLMEEMPTVVVNPLPSEMVEHSWYVVLNRPYAFVQWLDKANIPEKYVLMSEPDHIFLRPIPNFMNGESPAAFPFFYIEPSKKENIKLTKKFTGEISLQELEQIAPIGNSPTFMNKDDMKKVMPLWMNMSIAIFKDTEANQVWGWVQEMYAFTIAAFNAGVRHIDVHLHMQSQPPWDSQLFFTPHRPYYILHYTYGMDYKLTGEFTPGKFGEWRFDKRTYSSKPPPRKLGDPPKAMQNDLVRKLIDSINEATDALPCWDHYYETGKALPCPDTAAATTTTAKPAA